MIKFLTTRLSVIVMAWADREEGVRGAGGGGFPGILPLLPTLFHFIITILYESILELDVNLH